MSKLTQDELKRQLHYDPLTGEFTRVIAKTCVNIGDIAGHKNQEGYVRIKIACKSYLAHRLAWLYEKGYTPENQIDHINRVRDDNRIINLREASPTCNMRNRKTAITNTSGIVGVCWHKNKKKWIAQIMVKGENIHLGYFISKKDAAKARWNAEVEYNFPNCNTTSSAYLYLRNKEGQYDRF